ncbi:MAG: hypothetical protein HON27_13555 [Candidatus Marinimicrobia bacterium]|jgi:hypothetical protein|nr:hypothetical protein [Candidatus Neomarinimicrobiota bacterium]
MNQLRSELKGKVKYVLIVIVGIIIGACSAIANDSGLYIDVEPRLPLDSNGYFHLDLLRDTWQTTHRISGHISFEGEPAENVRMEWTSSHYWHLNDTLGYYINYGYTDQLEYLALDTSYIIGFNNFVVPTINCCSYSNADGEINTMITPVRSMIGDTMSVRLQFSEENLIGEIFIVLD